MTNFTALKESSRTSLSTMHSTLGSVLAPLAAAFSALPLWAKVVVSIFGALFAVNVVLPHVFAAVGALLALAFSLLPLALAGFVIFKLLMATRR
jgi:hypothetical protein